MDRKTESAFWLNTFSAGVESNTFSGRENVLRIKERTTRFCYEEDILWEIRFHLTTWTVAGRAWVTDVRVPGVGPVTYPRWPPGVNAAEAAVRGPRGHLLTKRGFPPPHFIKNGAKA